MTPRQKPPTASATKPPQRRNRAVPLEAPVRSFYGDQFRREQLETLPRLGAKDIQGEIDLLRILLRRVVEQVQSQEELEPSLEALNAIGSACMRLARMVEKQNALAAGSSNTRETISAALAEVVKELGIKR